MYEEIKEKMVEVCHKLWQKGWVAANDGNVTVKVAEGRYLATQTGVSKADITPDKIGLIDDDFNIIEAKEGWRPSSEVKMHLRCYKERPDITAVVHAHPPTATGFAIARIPLDEYTMPEAIIFLGSVPIAPYGTPGTEEVPESIVPYLPNHDTILLMNHGALTVGVDLTQAYYRMETLEHFAKVSLVAHQLGGAVELERNKIEECCEIAKAFPIRHPGYKKYRD